MSIRLQVTRWDWPCVCLRLLSQTEPQEFMTIRQRLAKTSGVQVPLYSCHKLTGTRFRVLNLALALFLCLSPSLSLPPSPSLSTYRCAYMHIVKVCLHVSMYACMHACMYVYVYIFVYMYVYIHMYLYIYACTCLFMLACCY